MLLHWHLNLCCSKATYLLVLEVHGNTHARLSTPTLPLLCFCLPAACSDSSSPTSSMHPSPSNNLLVPAGGGDSGLPDSPGPSQQQTTTAATPAHDLEQMPCSPAPPQLAPSLITCASTMHETSFDAVAEALEAALAAERMGNGVRVSQLDDVPEEVINSPREAQCNSPFSNVQR
jgi:hypothetical protein